MINQNKQKWLGKIFSVLGIKHKIQLGHVNRDNTNELKHIYIRVATIPLWGRYKIANQY